MTRLLLLLAAVFAIPMSVALAEVPPVIPPGSLWTPPVVTALVASIFTGLAMLLTAAGGIYLQGKQLARQLQITKDLSKEAVVQLNAVGTQLDGQQTELKEKIAALELMLSSVSGNTIRSDNAQQAADEHRQATIAATAKRDAAIAPKEDIK